MKKKKKNSRNSKSVCLLHSLLPSRDLCLKTKASQQQGSGGIVRLLFFPASIKLSFLGGINLSQTQTHTKNEASSTTAVAAAATAATRATARQHRHRLPHARPSLVLLHDHPAAARPSQVSETRKKKEKKLLCVWVWKTELCSCDLCWPAFSPLEWTLWRTLGCMWLCIVLCVLCVCVVCVLCV